jgi:hypothetical protein
MFRSALLAVGLLAFACLSSAVADDKKDSPLSEPKKSIEHQLKLIKDGDVDKLKACFTARQQDKITKEAVAAAQQQLGKMTIDDLVKDIVMSEQGGVKQAKITTKKGRTLTTLILTDGKWLADTIWFK